MFKDLIADLQGLAGTQATLAKSQSGDGADAVIQAAGATGGDSGDGGEGAAGADAGGGDGTAADAASAAGADGAGAADDHGDDVVKSFEVTLDNGKKFQAVDASDILKSFETRFGEIETSTGEAIGLCVDLMKSIVADNADLRSQLAKLAGSGAGRRATLTVVPRQPATGGGSSGSTTLVKSDASGMKPEEFLVKSERALADGHLSGRELSLIETLINRHEPIPAPLIQKVMGSAAA